MAWCVGARRGVLKALIDAYKFERVKAADRTLAKLLHESTPLLTDNVVVTCVPTASSHIRVRGYDHAERVAREFAKLRALPYRSMLERTSGETQHFATRRERFAQAGNAFRWKESAESVLLIDDILTTGASLLAAVRILREGGARKVYLGVIARQPLDELDDL